MLLIYKRKLSIISSKPVATPIEQNHRLSEALGGKKVNRKMYQQLVRRLIYLAQTRSNIASYNECNNQFMHDQKEIHLQAVY